MNKQLPLNIQLPEGISFNNFYPGANEEAVHAVEHCLHDANESLVYLWGANGTGKSHLLQAACHRVAEQGGATAYIPLAQYQDFTIDILQGLEVMTLVCIDDAQMIAGESVWEQALFHCFNRLRDSGKSLIISADKNPASLTVGLQDLKSRLAWGVVVQMHTLTDAQKLSALQLRAQQRGFDFPDEVGRYLLSRYPRDMHALFSLLESLDQATLVQKRKLTVPFVKAFIQANPMK